MDPLTALSAAGTIIQLVDFGSRVIFGSCSIYKSAGGALPVNEELEITTRHLTILASKLRRPLQSRHLPASQGQNAQLKALRDLCDGCLEVADELLVRLEALKAEGRHQKWKSFKQAVKAAWVQKEVDALHQRLCNFRRSLETHILAGLRYELWYHTSPNANCLVGIRLT
jgi:hypothetical protein